jgi:preprotein translocase subunit SecA
MFTAMMDGIKEESVGYIFNLEVQVEEEAPAAEEAPVEVSAATAAATAAAHAPQIRAKGLAAPSQPQNLKYAGPDETGETVEEGGTVTNADDPFAGVGRNADCPCGSGKKYKKCHGAPGGPTGLTTRVNG